MNWVFAGCFGLLLWFAIAIDNMQQEVEDACKAKGGVLMQTTYSQEDVCISKEYIIK